MLKKILLAACLLTTLPAFAGKDFKQLCYEIAGHSSFVPQVYIDKIYAATTNGSYHDTVGIKNNNFNAFYHIHKDNRHMTELAKIAYLTGNKVSVCIRRNSASVDELVGIIIGNYVTIEGR